MGGENNAGMGVKLYKTHNIIEWCSQFKYYMSIKRKVLARIFFFIFMLIPSILRLMLL